MKSCKGCIHQYTGDIYCKYSECYNCLRNPERDIPKDYYTAEEDENENEL